MRRRGSKGTNELKHEGRSFDGQQQGGGGVGAWRGEGGKMV